MLDNVGSLQRDPEEQPQCSHSVIENRHMRTGRRQMQLKASDVLEARRIRRSAEECSKVLDGADVTPVGSLALTCGSRFWASMGFKPGDFMTIGMNEKRAAWLFAAL